MDRPVTPPPRPSTSAALQLTPEQVKQVEINRLRAKANQRQREVEASASSTPNANNKRPIGVVPATSNSPTAPGPSKSKPLGRDSRLGKYFDYDLSKMVNSKGGFLVEDDKEVDEDLLRKEKERERERIQKNMEPPVYLDPDLNPKCRDCGSIMIDHNFRKTFGCLVCKTCQHDHPEKYSLLTKTECKQDYLLTDPELRDEDLLPHMLKANPHKSTYSNMMLYVRYQVEEFAWKKWGSPEALDAEYEKRTAEKSKKKNRKFEEGLRDLRRRTKESVWQRKKDEEHKHVFGPVQARRGEAGQQIATALELERLDIDLFRSKTLWLPSRARGVFGGQVISQAIVSATNSVDPAYGLHSLHCYFLASASAATPIVYFVERLRDGRSYLTRAVKALQNGKVVFMMMCSFQKPEPWQPARAWGMPSVPPPEDCRLEEERYEEMLRQEGLHPKIAQLYREFMSDRSKSPIAIKLAIERDTTMPGITRICYWMQARDIPEYDAPFQKCILGYISDLQLLSAASQALGLQRFGRGPKATSMTSTIDHSICFYDDTFDCGDWLLYVMSSPAAGSGRGIVYGQLYTRKGKLVAATTQEGVVRADIRGPEDTTKARL
ncbi:thioesterase-like superfamily-domain-containing protein [Mycena albidolilacea]|uniref:DNA repair protein RAD14 n=1 Tax=Mycena albidolilacea TaxID=1033008 RepID=A0AAD7AFT2_9AGAR|nr:thioesterase-like superfamily-domain-containing protein [Mycena albidolilacea]